MGAEAGAEGEGLMYFSRRPSPALRRALWPALLAVCVTFAVMLAVVGVTQAPDWIGWAIMLAFPVAFFATGIVVSMRHRA